LRSISGDSSGASVGAKALAVSNPSSSATERRETADKAAHPRTDDSDEAITNEGENEREGAQNGS